MGSGVSSTELTIPSMHGRPRTSVKRRTFGLDLDFLRAVGGGTDSVDGAASGFLSNRKGGLPEPFFC